MKYDDWQKLPHGPPDLERLEAFEDRLGCVLPADFRRWLEVVNGGKPKNTCVVVSEEFGISCFHHIYGFHSGPDYSQLDEVNQILEGNLNSGLVAFGDDAGGNQFTISVRGEDYGVVIFWDHETGDEYVLSANFREFIPKLRNEDQFIPRDDLEEILSNDDVASLEQWLVDKDIDARDESNRSPIENAALHGSVECIKYLHRVGAKQFDSILWLKKHLKFRPEFQNIIDLIEGLYPNNVGNQP